MCSQYLHISDMSLQVLSSVSPNASRELCELPSRLGVPSGSISSGSKSPRTWQEMARGRRNQSGCKSFMSTKRIKEINFYWQIQVCYWPQYASETPAIINYHIKPVSIWAEVLMYSIYNWLISSFWCSISRCLSGLVDGFRSQISYLAILSFPFKPSSLIIAVANQLG